MKFKPILLASALAALPLATSAQEPPTPQEQAPRNEAMDTKLVTTSGKVQSFDAGHSITITKPNGEQATFSINESSQVPKTVEIGMTVTISTTTASGVPVVKTITTTPTTTKETKRKAY